MTTPISSSRQSVQPRSHWRTLARRVAVGGASPERSPVGMAGAMVRATAPMITASPMNCTGGVTPSAAHPAPIPDPTAAPTDQAPCIKGMRVRPAARSIADPSTFISTSSVPIPKPMNRKATLTRGSDGRVMATPMTAKAAATTRSDAVTPPRLPSRWSTGAEMTRPAMAPTVTPARSRPIVAVPMPSSALTAGSRGPGGDGDATEAEGGHDRSPPPQQGRPVNNGGPVCRVRATQGPVLVGVLGHRRYRTEFAKGAPEASYRPRSWIIRERPPRGPHDAPAQAGTWRGSGRNVLPGTPGEHRGFAVRGRWRSSGPPPQHGQPRSGSRT